MSVRRACWSPALSMNLALVNEQATIEQRCAHRYDSLEAAQAACELSLSTCGGITRDGGLHCGDGQVLQYERRTRREIHNTNAHSWIPLPRGADGSCSKQALKAFSGKVVSRSGGGGSASGRAANGRSNGQTGGHRDTVAPPLDVHGSLQIRSRTPGRYVHSERFCVGPCCSKPLQRNRTCAFRDLLFVPPHHFYYMSAQRVVPSTHATFLHNRFSGGDTTGAKSRSYFAPESAPLAAALNVTRVVESPLYIGADVHSNVAHLMLDSVFPSVISLLRLHAGLAEERQRFEQRVANENTAAVSSRRPPAKPGNFSLPDAVSGLFTFLLYDSPGYANWHRGKKERTWTSTLAGRGVVDLPELARVCPTGCIIKTAWVGAGHVGLCAVDEQNVMGGARLHRALFRFRHRIFNRWGVPHTPLLAGADGSASPAGALPSVLVVQTKRVVTNLGPFVSAINKAGIARARLIKWETMSFVDQLKAMRTAAVQVSGVGSAQINQFLLPRGAVAVCLGWRDEHATHRIHYFDHHILRSLDHVRVVYYPSYSQAELRGASNAVTLDLPKAVDVIKRALTIYHSGYSVPLPEDVNTNAYDRAWAALVRETNSEALQMRTDDYDWAGAPPPKECTTYNGIEQMFWGTPRGPTTACHWYAPVPRLIKEFDL